jgi:hypothetical protein
MLGRKASEETKENMSKSRIGLNTWSKGRKLNEEQLKNYHEARERNKLKKLQNVDIL